MNTKICPNCQRDLPSTSDFFWVRTGTQLLYSWCKDCNREKARLRQAARRKSETEKTKLLEEKARYAQSEKGRLAKQKQSETDNHKRRSRLIAAPYLWTMAHWAQAKEEWGHACAYCGGTTALLTQDHFIPLSHPACPGTLPKNMVPACQSCNSSKGALMPEDWHTDKQRIAQIADWLATR